MKKWPLIFTSVSLLLIALIHLSIREYEIISNRKVWRHKGGANGGNAIESSLATIKSQQKEIELDFIFHQNDLFLRRSVNNKFVLTETFSNLMKAIEEKEINLWIDLKPMDFSDYFQALDILKPYFKFEAETRFIIETKSLLFSALMRLKGYPVSYWYDVRSSELSRQVYKVILPLFLSYFKIRYISHDYRNQDSYIMKYKGERLIFTLNDKKLNRYYCNKKIKVILSDLEAKAVDSIVEACPNN